jgi:NitT/TauT family transport system ATP-binding protein
MNFPADVTLAQLRAFLKLLRTSGGTVHLHTVATEFHMDLTKLLPVLDAAEMIGLVTVEKGEAKLTKEGAKMQTPKERAHAVSDTLSKVEPFATALACEGKFTGVDVAKKLSSRGIRWHHEDEVNSLIVSEILVHWGIRAGLLDYDGTSFTPRDRRESS